MEGTWGIRDLQPIIVSHRTIFFIPIQETNENIENTFLHISYERQSHEFNIKSKATFCCGSRWLIWGITPTHLGLWRANCLFSSQTRPRTKDITKSTQSISYNLYSFFEFLQIAQIYQLSHFISGSTKNKSQQIKRFFHDPLFFSVWTYWWAT